MSDIDIANKIKDGEERNRRYDDKAIFDSIWRQVFGNKKIRIRIPKGTKFLHPAIK